MKYSANSTEAQSQFSEYNHTANHVASTPGYKTSKLQGACLWFKDEAFFFLFLTCILFKA